MAEPDFTLEDLNLVLCHATGWQQIWRHIAGKRVTRWVCGPNSATHLYPPDHIGSPESLYWLHRAEQQFVYPQHVDRYHMQLVLLQPNDPVSADLTPDQLVRWCSMHAPACVRALALAIVLGLLTEPQIKQAIRLLQLR